MRTVEKVDYFMDARCAIVSLQELLSVASQRLNQDLSYVEILAGRPGAWLVKKIFFICMQSKKLKRKLKLKFKMISRKCLNFMIAFLVYE